MGNRLEIIITTRDALSTPRAVRFEELYDLRKDIASIMFLWDTNSYYVDSLSRMFMINGGRRIVVDMDDCEVIYRKRNSQVMSMTDGASRKDTAWIVGIQETTPKGKMRALKITDGGFSWQWIDSL